LSGISRAFPYEIDVAAAQKCTLSVIPPFVDAMNDEPKKQEPEIMPPVPEVEPERNVPEIPPDKDAPEKKGPVRAHGNTE
jgi:hypothetical protein